MGRGVRGSSASHSLNNLCMYDKCWVTLRKVCQIEYSTLFSYSQLCRAGTPGIRCTIILRALLESSNFYWNITLAAFTCPPVLFPILAHCLFERFVHLWCPPSAYKHIPAMMSMHNYHVYVLPWNACFPTFIIIIDSVPKLLRAAGGNFCYSQIGLTCLKQCN